ncbi:extracellular solute-binding protein [Paenibacillus mesophilus]|uniref:ABC transporter substrate-binding protein n=1 Tax=Paenibacillus mesophilus TaxID=2582849 RepID=UPI00110D2922|nr:extracellular solute-binding protein [Paenibacillus mesophilus]TMV52835.1 extracellular solute-binding protein [Paenibacillus mesophilus]
MKKKITITAALAAMLAAGCSNTVPKDSAAGPAPAKDPVSLTLFRYYAGLTEQEFDQYIAKSVKSKFPHVTINYVSAKSTNASELEQMLASGDKADIIFTSNYSLPVVIKMGLAETLDESMKKAGVKPDRFEPSVVDALAKYGAAGNTYAVPFSLNFAALLYNKDIFDRFGVPYPKEMSTWDDILEMSKKLTRMDGATQFRGIIMPSIKQVGDQLSLAYADKEKHKATIHNDEWKKVFEFMAPFYEIPGASDGGKTPAALKTFTEERSVAMNAEWISNAIGPLAELEKNGKPMSWGMTTYPSFKGSPGVGRAVDFHLMTVSKTSKHKELVFEILKDLTSEEVQTTITKNGRLTVLNNDVIKNQFGGELAIMKGKDLPAALKSKPARMATPTDYDVISSTFLAQGLSSMLANKKDLNTALRDAQEAADKKIAEERAK